MSIEIKHFITSQVIYRSELPYLRDALIQAVKDGADLRGADLRGADLRGADLRDADLRDADLRDADLRGANLRGAYLIGADLRDAEGLCQEKTTPLLMLLDQPGKIRAYKIVNGNNEGHINGGLKYEIGKTVAVTDADTSIHNDCGKGINVATLDWCLRELRDGHRILILEFEAKDIAAIPTCTDGKFRLHRALVVGEKDISHLVDK